MARISTYPTDATPHMDDHVIGTNAGSASGNHANETVVFRISDLRDLLIEGISQVFVFTGGRTEAYQEGVFYDDDGRDYPYPYDTDPTTGIEYPKGTIWGEGYVEGVSGTNTAPPAAGDPYSDGAVALLPIITIHHGLQSVNPDVRVYAQPPEDEAVGEELVITEPDSITIVDENTVTIDLGVARRYVGYITFVV